MSSSDDDQPIEVFRSLNAAEAALVRSLLEGSEIETVAFDGNLIGLNPLLGSALGGVRLAVRKRDVEKARELLAAFRPEADDPSLGTSLPVDLFSKTPREAPLAEDPPERPEAAPERSCDNCSATAGPDDAFCDSCGGPVEGPGPA